MTATPQATPDRSLPADDAARAMARTLLTGARFAALAFTDPVTESPGISRIALGLDGQGCPVSLVSALAQHEAALRAHPLCALMVGEVGDKGDPLTHPRLMIRARAEFVAPDDPKRPALRALWLADHPKSTLYVDFSDFSFVRLRPISALLNGGFGRAFRLEAADLAGMSL
jgi:heme iron utilization protein